MIINEKYFKQYSPIPLNYNMAEIKNYIPVACKIWLIPIIGYDFFEEIEEQVENNNVSEEIATLLTEGGLWQYLSFATVYEALPLCWSHISEVGVTKGKSDNSDSLDLKDMTYVSQHLRNQVEVLKEQLKTWLCQHYQYYPNLNVCDCGCDCCNNNPKLKYPNPNQQIYTTIRKNTNLR